MIEITARYEFEWHDFYIISLVPDPCASTHPIPMALSLNSPLYIISSPLISLASLAYLVSLISFLCLLMINFSSRIFVNMSRFLFVEYVAVQ